jgi:hypothetical protein
MKKLFVIAVIVLLTGTVYSQILKKDVVIAVSTYTITLQPGVTMEQYVDFLMKKYIPEYEKNFPGSKMYVLHGDRGEKKDQIGFMWSFESVKVRDKYYPTESDFSDAAQLAWGKMDAISTEEGKYAVNSSRVFTDWVIK